MYSRCLTGSKASNFVKYKEIFQENDTFIIPKPKRRALYNKPKEIDLFEKEELRKVKVGTLTEIEDAIKLMKHD